MKTDKQEYKIESGVELLSFRREPADTPERRAMEKLKLGESFVVTSENIKHCTVMRRYFMPRGKTFAFRKITKNPDTFRIWSIKPESKTRKPYSKS